MKLRVRVYNFEMDGLPFMGSYFVYNGTVYRLYSDERYYSPTWKDLEQVPFVGY